MAIQQPEPVQVPLIWIGLDDTPIELANVFQAQVSAPGEIILNIGQTAPPALSGTPEERAAQIEKISFVQSRTLGRLALTPHRVREMITLLQQALAGHDQVFPR
jgi:hypothetical protein